MILNQFVDDLRRMALFLEVHVIGDGVAQVLLGKSDGGDELSRGWIFNGGGSDKGSVLKAGVDVGLVDSLGLMSFPRYMESMASKSFSKDFCW